MIPRVLNEEFSVLEIWKDIDCNGKYQVSSFGRIRSIKCRNVVNGYILKQWVTSNGYSRVTLYLEGNPKYLTVHRLVAKAFCLKLSHHSEVNHISGVKSNNYKENLEWVTREANMQHAWRIGLQTKVMGTDNHAAKLTEEYVVAIKSNKGKVSQRSLAKKYKVCQTTIAKIMRGEIWKHVH